MNDDSSIPATLDEHEEEDADRPRPIHPQNEDRLTNSDLEAAYRAMAEDQEGEAEALEWIEGTIGDGIC